MTAERTEHRPDARLLAVCVVARERTDPGGSPGRTAIDKQPVPGPVPVTALGLTSDHVCDVAHHGGEEQALYAYAEEDAAGWAAELGEEVPPGRFGENLRTSGIDVTGAEIGERWRLGEGPDSVVVEVTSPRIPCSTFQRWMRQPHWVKRFTDRGAPGAYLAVVREGTIEAGDPITVVHRPGHGITIADAFLRAEPATMQRLLDAAEAGQVVLRPRLAEFAVRTANRA